MASDSYKTDFVQMERDLYAALESDINQQVENEARIRAASQRLSSYDEFKEIVKGAHLRPVSQSRPRSTIWNLTHKRRGNNTEHESCSPYVPCVTGPPVDCNQLPTTTEQFISYWNNIDIVDRLSLLLRLGPAGLGHLFRVEMPADILGEILQTLIAFNPNLSDIITVVGLLEALTEIKRFSISLQFLSSLERSTCNQLMEKLLCSLNDRQQDLAEHGITEWTLQQLKKKFFP